MDPSPSSLDGRATRVVGSPASTSGVRRLGEPREAALRRSLVCSSNFGIRRRVRVLPEELDGIDGLREDC